MRGRVAAAVAGAVVLAAGTALIVKGSDYPGMAVPGGQGPTTLGEAEATYEESFSVVSTVRELPDGQVLVADALGQVLVRLDLDAGTADTLGRVGEGPEEYRQPDAVWPLPGGRTLLVDLGNGRLTELSPALEFGATRPYAIGELGPGRELVLAIPQAVDDRGRLYFRSFGRMGGSELASDSAYILRLDLESEVVDSVGRIKLPGTTTRTTGSANNQNTSVSPIPLSAADAWGVAGDGRVVIVRSGDYRVDWVAPGGGILSGPSVPYEAVRIGRGEQQEWADSRSETGGGLGISISVSNNAMAMTASRGGASNDDDLDQYEWPDFAPAFYGRPVPVDGGGRAWVRRHVEAGDAPVYDVFDGAGEREMIVRCCPGAGSWASATPRSTWSAWTSTDCSTWSATHCPDPQGRPRPQPGRVRVDTFTPRWLIVAGCPSERASRSISASSTCTTGTVGCPSSSATRMPSMRMASGRPRTIPAGDTPLRSSSSMMALDELDPIVRFITRIRPASGLPCCG